VYGSRHGADRDHGGRRGADGDPSSHKLHNEEYLLAVSQEHSGSDLGSSLAFFTSQGRVILISGHRARKAANFAAASGLQISGLRFRPGHERHLEGVETEEATPWMLS
ncbi:unnamed protein product, partial [Polarella glacialis]